MLIKNIDENLVNGSMGRVVRFCDPATYSSEVEQDVGGPKPASSSASELAKTTRMTQLLPVVQFAMPNGLQKEMLVTPESFKVELPNGEVQACRTQVSRIQNQTDGDRSMLSSFL